MVWSGVASAAGSDARSCDEGEASAHGRGAATPKRPPRRRNRLRWLAFCRRRLDRENYSSQVRSPLTVYCKRPDTTPASIFQLPARELVTAVCRACARQRFASSILNPFSLCGLAPRIAASAALRKLAASAVWPPSADSASGDRHGLVPTPPKAMRARVTFPPTTVTTTAADARANS